MNRLFGAFVVLAVVFAIIMTGFQINTKTASSVSEKIYNSAEYQKQGNSELAKKEIKSALNEWESNIETMLLFMSHGKLDQIEESINIADTYINLGDENMFLAECRRALILLEHFESVEYPSVDNIF